MNFYIEGDCFYKDSEPFRILSGAIHYFRVPREYWRDRLLKLRECGMNTVETYVPWNAHEKHEGQFDFSGMLDLGAFLDTARELGLLAIVRPGPFICAEWEGGGLPAWLLNVSGLRIRCDNAPYLQKVKNYLSKLFGIIVPRLCTKGGNVIMLQVENEYGSYGNDKVYLKKLENMYRELGADCLLFRADGTDPAMMAYADTGIYMANTFGSNPAHGREVRDAMGFSGPFFCAEYWCGWFDHWYEQHHVRDPKNVRDELKWFLENGAHINYYMFHGGTNFGFWSGANGAPGVYAPATTSYDYDGLLSEAGDRTEKYYLVRDLLAKFVGVPALTASETPKAAYGEVPFDGTAELFAHLHELHGKEFFAPYPLTLEQTETYYGYVLYEQELTAPHASTLIPEPLADRVSVFLDETPVGIMERGRKTVPVELPQTPAGGSRKLSLLCENMGRVNYGPETLDSKGLRGVRLGNAYRFGWKTTALPMEELSGLTFDAFRMTGAPAFHRAVLHIDGAPADTFLSVRGLHKGFVTVNGINIGRYCTDAGPQYTLYVPAPFLKEGSNEIIVFESDGTACTGIAFTDAPDFG